MQKKNNIYFILNFLIIINFIIGISSNSNKINYNNRKLDTYYQYVKLKVKTTGNTGTIRIFGDKSYQNSEMYCNE